MIRLRRARLPRTVPRMIARFLSDDPAFLLEFAAAATVDGVVEVDEALELRLAEDEV